MTFDRWQVVRVPFPLADRAASKNRPALVLSSDNAFNAPSGHVVLAMITSAHTPPGRWTAPSTTSPAPACPRRQWSDASSSPSTRGSSAAGSDNWRPLT